ncbi:MAG: hypothetical protein R3C05_23725 [Pirellulaceae bacterium]
MVKTKRGDDFWFRVSAAFITSFEMEARWQEQNACRGAVCQLAAMEWGVAGTTSLAVRYTLKTTATRCPIRTAKAHGTIVG